jgi:very-short-patch-repair endonuclease
MRGRRIKMPKIITQEEFLRRAEETWGDRYDYSNSVYKGSHIKLEVVCGLHGKFETTLSGHISRKNGCPKCGDALAAKKRAYNIEHFVERSRDIFGNLYDYSESVYINNHTKIKIRCKIHGIWETSPHTHTSMKHGCPFCGHIVASGKRTTSSAKEFIDKANIVHDFKYNYDQVVYVKALEKVKIGCPFHGIFLQKPGAHLYGQGCPLCRTSKQEVLISKYLTEREIPFTYQYSVLKSSRTGKYLPYDFYIPSKNLLLEFDGKFHFMKVYKEHNLEKQKVHDRYKDMWAYHNGYNLIRINHNQNLEQELNKIFMEEK